MTWIPTHTFFQVKNGRNTRINKLVHVENNIWHVSLPSTINSSAILDEKQTQESFTRGRYVRLLTDLNSSSSSISVSYTHLCYPPLLCFASLKMSIPSFCEQSNVRKRIKSIFLLEQDVCSMIANVFYITAEPLAAQLAFIKSNCHKVHSGRI